MKEPVCPECEKMRVVQKQSQAIGEFLEWLQEETDYTICRFEGDEHGNGRYYPAHVIVEKVLAEFFDIDLNKVEEERRAILAYMEAQHD